MSKSLVLLVTLLLLVGCKSSPQESADNSGRKIGSDTEGGGLFSSIFKGSSPKSIALPPDLISTANDKVLENHKQAEVASGEEVLPSVIGAKVVNQDGQRWLEVEADAQEVWDTLANFWAAEQIDLVEFKPAAGLMETDWVSASAEAEKKGVFSRLFNRVAGKGTSFDKYKLRLEKDDEDVTKIFVTHRFTEKKESNFNSQIRLTQWEWVEGDSDQEKVAQLLQVMVLLFETPEARQNTSA